VTVTVVTRVADVAVYEWCTAYCDLVWCHSARTGTKVITAMEMFHGHGHGHQCSRAATEFSVAADDA
jgi:hypothetical protein